MLGALGIHNYLELTTGRSWNHFRGLDAYLRVISRGMPPPSQEAWYVINTQNPARDRILLHPDDWWRCRHWHSYSQKEYAVSDWIFMNNRVLARISMPYPGYSSGTMQRLAESHPRAACTAIQCGVGDR